MPPDDASFAVLAHKVDSMHNDFAEMRSVLKDLTAAINKLALVEERQTQFSASQERAFKLLERLEAKIDTAEGRIDALEREAPTNQQTSKWVSTSVWGVVVFAFSIAAAFIMKKLGLQ